LALLISVAQWAMRLNAMRLVEQRHDRACRTHSVNRPPLDLQQSLRLLQIARVEALPCEDDCARLGFYVNGDPDLPDLNRLFTDCVWDANTQRWERKQ
jgi:hypothetical protein